MRKVALPSSFCGLSPLAGCQSNAAKVKQLQDQYNAEYPAMPRTAWIQ